jgi:hypothetical protein
MGTESFPGMTPQDIQLTISRQECHTHDWNEVSKHSASMMMKYVDGGVRILICDDSYIHDGDMDVQPTTNGCNITVAAVATTPAPRELRRSM